MWVACLAATGMSVSDMRQYMANGRLGAEAAARPDRAAARTAAAARARGRAALALRQRYVGPQDRLLARGPGRRHGRARAALRRGAGARRRAHARPRTTRSTHRRTHRSQHARPTTRTDHPPCASTPTPPPPPASRSPPPPSSAATSAPNDVLIEIQYAGICHSDIHTVRGDWGPQPYPVVPGHEIVGVVTEVGADVTRHQVGDRVGVGCMVNSCRECEQLPQRRRAVLPRGHRRRPTPASTATAPSPRAATPPTSSSTRTSCLRVPDGIDPAAAAPLLCAGITTYSPLRHWNAGPGKKVAVVGLGGLGPHGRQDRPRDGRRGDRAVAVAEEAGGRPAPRRRPLLRHQRPATPSSSSPAGST